MRGIEDLPKLVEEASALALVGAREHGVRVSFNIDPTVDHVLADKVQIQQVLLNLIRNGIDAMDESPVRELTITVEPPADFREHKQWLTAKYGRKTYLLPG